MHVCVSACMGVCVCACVLVWVSLDTCLRKLVSFGRVETPYIGEEVNEGFSNDLNPNEITLEFRFFDFDPLFNSEQFPDVETKFQDPIRHELKEIRFYFTLRFKEGKIVSIRRPKKVIADVTKLMLS